MIEPLIKENTLSIDGIRIHTIVFFRKLFKIFLG